MMRISSVFLGCYILFRGLHVDSRLDVFSHRVFNHVLQREKKCQLKIQILYSKHILELYTLSNYGSIDFFLTINKDSSGPRPFLVNRY